MSVGKSAAQAVHANQMANAALITEEQRHQWALAPHRTVIVLEARDEKHLANIQQYLFERGIKTYYVIDEGVNEVDPHIITAMATEIIDGSDEVKRKSLSTFKLYKDIAKFTMEFER